MAAKVEKKLLFINILQIGLAICLIPLFIYWFSEGNSIFEKSEFYLYLGFITICVLFFGQMLFSQALRPLNLTKEITAKMAKGILPKDLEVTENDDISNISAELSLLSNRLYYYTNFIHDIGQGRFNDKFQALNEDDILGRALADMQKNLINAHDREKERNWIINGIAEIGEILRSYNNIDALGDPVIKFLCSKINAVQGAIYVLSDDHEGDDLRNTFTMVACYAFNRKKHVSNTFAIGQGLAGQAAFEKASIFRTEIPDTHFTIKSGLLGDKKPSSVLLVPMITDEKVYGMLEFGAIHTLKNDEIKFAEEVAPIIARTVFNILVNEKTTNLLKQSQEMSAELQSQQEVLRKNAEEMVMAQEELTRVNSSLTEQMEEVNRSQKRMQLLLQNASEVITIYEDDSTIKYISPSVENILGYKPEELIGLKGKTNVKDEDFSLAQKMFNSLLEEPDKIQTIQYQFRKKDGEFIWLEATGKNLLADTAVNGILINCRDITSRHKAETEERMRRNMQSLSENSPDIITRITKEGQITYTNPAIETYAGLEAAAFISKSISELDIAEELVKAWSDTIAKVSLENAKTSTECNLETPLGQRIVQVNGIPEYNEENLESVLVVAHDITERKVIELEIQDKNKKINESINYSKRIQTAIVPDTSIVNRFLPESFIFYRPKDVVSGDFPWFLVKGDDLYIAAVDCTGHGVPGAMLSLVGCFLLNDVVENSGEKTPAKILDIFDEKFNTRLNVENNPSSIKDGMDLALCRINLKGKFVEFAGAHRPLYHLANKEVIEYKGDKWAIGGGTYRNQTNFTSHRIEFKKGESIYFFSDGLPDQFGGPDNKKFGPKRIREMIADNAGKNMGEMSRIFETEFDNWMGKEKQMDDVLLIGIKF